jgi:hypothetical protein
VSTTWCATAGSVKKGAAKVGVVQLGQTNWVLLQLGIPVKL